MSLVAQNVSVEIRPTTDLELLGVLNAFPVVPVPGGIEVEIGDAYAQETRRVVFELHVLSLAALGVRTVADVVLRYTSIGEQIAQHEVAIPLALNLVSADEATAAGADAEVTEEVVILRSARAQEQAREHADRGELEQAAASCRTRRTSSAGSRRPRPRRTSSSSGPGRSRPASGS